MNAGPTSRAERLQGMMAQACFGKDAARSFEGDLAGFLARHGVDADDAQAILAAPRRLGLYRELVRHNVVNVTRTMLVRTCERLEAVDPGRFERTMGEFLEEEGPKTHHLRDVPVEFVAWAAPRWRADASLPAWVVDHAEYELAEFTIAVAPRPGPPPALADVAIDRALVFADPHLLIRLKHAVHEMAPGDLRASAEARDVALFVYRDAEHVARFLDLTPLAAAILERLLAGSPLAAAMTEACRATGEPMSDAVLGGAARLLADLGTRGALLGARA